MRIVTTITDPTHEHFGQVTETEIEVPVPVNQWDAFDFKKRFTAQERIAIRTASKTNAAVDDFRDMLDTAGATGKMIKADDALLSDGLDLLESEGLIAQGRKAEILG